jgi:uncharacterized membrane protein YeaQ/YmgE (transglycosylase-associated protein family)
MNTFLWVMAGAALGWASYSFLGMSEGRGKMAAMVIGAIGGVLGGKLLAPMLTSPAAVPTDFSTSALVLAMLMATVVLFIGNVVYKRWDV